MKHGSIKAVCFFGLMCVAVLSAYGRDRPVALSAVVLESFNGETTREWHDGRQVRTYDFSWDIRASRFATTLTDEDGNETSFPRSTFVEAWPRALFGNNREGRLIQSFGINGRFDRQGHNWIDIFPVDADGAPFEIPMPGRVRTMDMWVWGSNFNFNLEAYVRDNQGIVHRVQFGSMAFTGWRNMSANIPGGIRQDNRTLPAHAPLHFVKFRIWTQPNERVDNFFVYLNRFQILTDLYESFFDGDELADLDFLAEFWAND